MGERVHVHIDFETVLPPGRVLAVLTDFTERRTTLWPSLDPVRYQVHEVGETWAEVTEGTAEPAVWARERYEWGPDWLSIKAIESNFCVPGDGTDLTFTPNGNGGSHIVLDWEREAAVPEWEPIMDAFAKDGEVFLMAAYRDRFESIAAMTE